MNRIRENFRRRDGQFGTPISVAIWLEHFFVQAHAAQLGEDGAHCDQEEGRRVGPLSWPPSKMRPGGATIALTIYKSFAKKNRCTHANVSTEHRRALALGVSESRQ